MLLIHIVTDSLSSFIFRSTPFMYMNEESTLIEGTERKINPDYCVKSKMIGYGLCTSLRLPFAYREYEAPYFPLSGPAHFGVNLIRGDEKLTTYQFKVEMKEEDKVTVGKIEFSTPGAYYDRTVGGTMRYSDVWNVKTLTFSTEKNGKSAQLQMSYNPNQKRHFIEGRTNLFTPQEVVSKLEVFQTGNMVSKQHGVSYTLNYGTYKFEHVTKYVVKESGYMLHSTTNYLPKKSVVGVLEYMKKEHKIVARFDANQLKQAFEFSGQWKKAASGNGIVLTGTHLTSQKTATLYMGYVNEENKKEFITSVDVLGKKASSVMGYYNKNGVKSYKHVVMVNGKTGKFVASFNDAKTTKKVEMKFVLDGKTLGESSAVLTNTDAEKSLFVVVSTNGKSAQTKVGYYNKAGEQVIKIEADAGKRHAELFFNLQSAEGYKYTFGGLAGKYSAGVRGIYKADNGKKMCMSMYYGLKDAEKQPMTTCFGYESLSTQNIHKRVSFEVVMNNMEKTFTTTVDVKQEGKKSSLVTSVMYNDESLLNEIFTVTFDGLLNTQVAYKLTVGKYFGGYKLFTTSQGQTGKIGAEAFYMEKNVAVVNTWAVKKIGKLTDRIFNTEVVVNGKTLPVTTSFNLATEKGAFSPAARLNIGEASVAYATIVTYVSGEYALMDEVVISNQGKALLKLFRKTELAMTEGRKEFSSKFGAVMFGKTYEYGYEAAFANQGTASKSAFDLIFRLQYSTTRKSVATFTFANNMKASSLLINVEYFPTKSVSHSIVYKKNINELSVDIEFLPKMNTKFMMRLDTANGYKLTTNFGLQWKKFKKSMQLVNTFKNNKKMLEMSTKIGSSSKFAITFEKGNQKKLTFHARVLKQNIKLMTILKKKVIKFNIIRNSKALVNVGLGFSRVGRGWKFVVLNRERSVFAVSGDYNKLINEAYMKIKMGKKEIGLTGRVQRGVLTTYVSYNKSIYFKIVAKKTNKLISIKFVAPTMKRDVTFSAEIEKATKALSLSAKSGKMNVGIRVRADWKAKVASIDASYNKHVSGIRLSATKKSITFTMTFTPKVSLKAVFEIMQDRILKMTIYRQHGSEMITETSMKYKLSRKMSEFVFEWNTDYFKRMTRFVKPRFNNIVKDMKQFLSKAQVQSTEYVSKTTDKMAKVAMDFVDNVDTSFDNINFIGARDQVGKTTLAGLRKMSGLVQKAFRELIKALNTIKKEMPALRKSLNKITVQTIKYIRSLPKQFDTNMKIVNANLKVLQGKMKIVQENLKEVQKIVMLVAKNLTESSRPVVNKAIELALKFKIRGMTMAELSKVVQKQAAYLARVYTKTAQEKLEMIQTEGKIFYEKATAFVLRQKLPYRKETVAEVIEIIREKIAELKLKVEEMKLKVVSFDYKKVMDEYKEFALNYKINGMTPEQHLMKFQEQAKQLPTETKKAILQLIKLIRAYKQEVEVIYGKVAKFAEPLTDHVILVKNSAVKRFSPLVKDALAVLEAEYEKINMPSMRPLMNYMVENSKIVEKFVTPLVRPLNPLYRNIMKQVRKLQVMGVRIGPMFDMNMALLTSSIEQYMTQSQKTMDKQMINLNKMVTKYTQMTPEQLVEKVFASSSELSEQAISYITTIYQQRKEYVQKTQQHLETVYADLKTQYTVLMKQFNSFSAQKPEDVLKGFYKNAEESILLVVEEMNSIVSQIAALDLANPSWKAWNEADILGHLAKYGVNQKAAELIKTLKDVKLSKLILDGIEKIKEIYNVVYSKAFVRAVRVYGRIEKVVDYVRSIPKKEYNEWYQELRTFALDNKVKFVDFVTKNYQISRESATNYYNTIMTLSTKNMEEMKALYNKRAAKVTAVYNRVAKQSQLFYDDVKQPTIDVTKHYQDIATTFVNKYYTQYEKIVMKYYNEMRVIVENKFEELKVKVESLKSLAEKQYGIFLKNYGDMTWEQVGEKLVKLGEAKYALAQKEYRKNYKKVEKIVAEYRQKVEKLYAEAKVEYQNYKTKFETEIKPRVIAKYKEIRVRVEKLIAEYKAKVTEVMEKSQAKAMELRAMGMKFYNTHKDKTFKKIYREIKAIVVKEFNTQYSRATKMYTEKSEEITKMANMQYKRLNTLVFDVILPEANLEIQSLINQTLKNSVIMAKEVVKAYTPHYNLIKRETIKYSKVLVDQMNIAIKKSEVQLKKTMVQLEKLVMELIEKMRNHEYTKKAIMHYEQALKHKYVVEAQQKLNKYIKIAQEKIEEVKAHPTTKRYTKIAQKQYNQMMKELKSMEKKINKMMKEPQFKRMMKVLKKIQESAEFTYNKLVKKMTPPVQRARRSVEQQMSTIPSHAQTAVVFFVDEPEEAFWTVINKLNSFVRESLAMVSDIDFEGMKSPNHEKYLSDAQEFVLQTLDEVTNEWTKKSANRLYRNAVQMTRDVSETLKALPKKIQRMAIKEYKQRMQQLKKWFKQSYQTLKKEWKECPMKEFVDNRIWREIVDEVKQHELTEAAYNVVDFTTLKAQQLKVLAMKQYKKQKAVIQKKYNQYKTEAITKYNTMKSELVAKAEEFQTKMEEQYSLLVRKTMKFIEQCDNFLETTTIADVVAMTVKQVKELKVKALQTKIKLEKAALKKVEEAKRILKEYETKAKEMYTKAQVKVEALYKKHVEPKITEYRDKAMKQYNKYYPQVEAKYLELKAKYLEMREKAMEKYQLYRSKGEKLFYAYKVKAIEQYTKTKADAYESIVESKAYAKLISLKSMTIKQTIEAVKKLPKQTEVLVKAMYADYSAKATAEFNQRYALLNEKYAELMKVYESKRDQMVEMAKPYTVPALKAYKWIENELVESATFVYRYHRVQERSVALRNYIVSEYKRLTPIVKQTLKDMAAEYKQLAVEYKQLAQIKAVQYKKIGQELAYDVITTAGDQTLRGIHSGLRYVDSIDMKALNKYQEQARSYFTELNKYISFDDGKITITVPHGAVTPSISHHIKKVGKHAKRTVQAVKVEAKKMLRKVKAELIEVQARAEKLRKQITKTIWENTVEVRGDLKKSMTINNKVARRVYDNAKIFGQKAYRKIMLKYKTLKAEADIYINKANRLAQKYYKQLTQMSQKAYLKSSEIFMDIYSAGIFKMHQRAYYHADRYYTIAKNQANRMMRQHKPTVMSVYKKYSTIAKNEAKKMKKDVLPYYRALKKALNDVKFGVPVQKALKPVIRQIMFATRVYQREAIKSLSKAKSMFCRRDPKLCKHLTESSRVHQKLFKKYFARASEVVATGKAQLDRTIRRLSRYINQPLLGDYKSSASMFGDFVLTFDKKHFQLNDEGRQGCSYLLAHDFVNNKFTVKTEGSSLVIDTPDMSVTIKKNGNVKAVVGKEVIKTLPVQSKSGHCKRQGNLIVCDFVTDDFKVVVDLKNEITTLSISGWYFGRTQGMFGTFNRESYDDWKLPNGKTTHDIYEFINNYELSGKNKCQVKATTKKSKCNKQPSYKCHQLFKRETSPLANFFETVNPEAFWEACISDTTPCGKKVNYESYCKSVAAFVSVARSNGQWVDYPTECGK